MSLKIGDIPLEHKTFDKTPSLIASFQSPEFRLKTSIERSEILNRTLFELIEEKPDCDFLLCEVTDFLAEVTRNAILDGPYNLTAFERWLNQLSGLSYEENRRIRGKIVGKYIPRDDFNSLFPIGQNRVHPNTHTVTAHTPPDLDSLTGSFLGWLDAFACRVGTSLTVWNVPLGKPGAVASRLFTLLYSDEIFYRVAKQKTLISHVAMDIVQQEYLQRVKGNVNIRQLDHQRYQNHIIHIDEDGYFLGDWRVSDVDAVAQVQRLLNMIMHAYEKEVVFKLTLLFSKPNFHYLECKTTLEGLLERTVPEYNLQSYDLKPHQIDQLDLYIRKVLGVSEGYRCIIKSFFQRMDDIAGSNFMTYATELQKIADGEFYDNDQHSDHTIDELFGIFHRCYQQLIDSTKILRSYLDRLDVAMAIKREILGYKPTMVSTKAEINEIRSKIKDYRHITVVFPDSTGRYVPVGVIHRDDLEQPVQGTISFRDFCNYDEIKLHDYLEVISAIDHHRTTINSQKAMVLSVADVQSSNVITAEKYFEMNDRYSTRGQSFESILEQIQALQSMDEPSHRELRILEKLYRKRRAHTLAKSTRFFIDPERELHDYLLCLNAIIDDTDLLNKCGWRDLHSIAELVNRIKSLQEEKEVEIIDFSDRSQDRRTLRRCIREMLECEELYSFYKVVYDHRQSVVDDLIRSVEPGKDTRFFEDRKIQNHSCSISQFKMFPGNWPSLENNRDNILTTWLNLNQQVRRKESGVDFFLHMVSTIPGAQEAYTGKGVNPNERDEFWLTGLSEADESISRMRQFLNSISKSPKHQSIHLNAHVEGPNTPEVKIYERVLKDTIGYDDKAFCHNDKLSRPVIIFHFNQGSLNSRKADITPFLPK